MRVTGLMLAILAIVLTVYGISIFIPGHGPENKDAEQANEIATESPSSAKVKGPGDSPAPPHQPTSVALNTTSNVTDGFRGEVHPLLYGQTRLEVTAQWTPIGKGRDKLERSVNPLIYSWFTELRPAKARQTYTERDLSVFLPVRVGDVGQMWSLDVNRIPEILKQFHPRPRMHLVASGRRAGPDGSFALLRAVSPAYLDILFRIHAEFSLTPDDWPGRPIAAWYTPAYFTGRILVNSQKGTVDYFRLELPTEKSLNVHLTVDATGFSGQAHDIVRVERMELTGGDAGLAERIPWSQSITPVESQARLAKVFYKSLNIDWVPVDQTLARSRSSGRPIFAVVSWGATDDQSC